MDVAELKASVNIVDVIGSYTPVTHTSEHSYWWHGVEHDSLIVNEPKQHYWWNSRGESGDSITWVMEREQLDFLEACERLRGFTGKIPNFSCLWLPPPPPPPILPLEVVDYCERFLCADESAIRWWSAKGLSLEACKRWHLGASLDHWGLGRTSVIPVFDNGKLVSIRHRIWGAEGGNKYRPHTKGCRAALFNADMIDDDCLIVEGEIKSMVLTESGILAVGIPGALSFRDDWLSRFDRCKRVYVCLDPALKTADGFLRARSVKWIKNLAEHTAVCELTLPMKPDDMVLACGAKEFAGSLAMAKRVGK